MAAALDKKYRHKQIKDVVYKVIAMDKKWQTVTLQDVRDAYSAGIVVSFGQLNQFYTEVK